MAGRRADAADGGSPNFKAAFADDALGGPGDADGRKRKSLGRRVSFAAKAKVRYIGNGSGGSADDAENAGNARANAEAQSPQQSPKGRTSNIVAHGSPSVRHAPPADVLGTAESKDHDSDDMSMVSTTSSGVKSVESRAPSVEVDVRDPQSSFSSYDSDVAAASTLPLGPRTSMPGVSSPLRTVAALAAHPGMRESIVGDDMDMTMCVGGLIGSARASLAGPDALPDYDEDMAISSPSSRRTSVLREEDTLDLSGLIASNAGAAVPPALLDAGDESGDDVRSGTVSPSSMDTMELTRSVGGMILGRRSLAPGELDGLTRSEARILSAMPQLPAEPVQSADADTVPSQTTGEALSVFAESDMKQDTAELGDTQSGSDDADMELTQAVGGMVADASDFGVSERTTSVVDVAGDDTVSFIGDTDAPAALQDLGSEPADEDAAEPEPQPAHHEATQDTTDGLFDHYVGRVSAAAGRMSDVSELTLTDVGGAASRRTIFRLSDASDLARRRSSPGRDSVRPRLFGARPSDFYPRLSTGRPSLGGLSDATAHTADVASLVRSAPMSPHTPRSLPPSAEESPTVTGLLPRASLSAFLAETEMQFLDRFASGTRRETAGRPRDSEAVLPARQLCVDGSASLVVDALGDACADLAGLVSSLRTSLAAAEERFDHAPPLAYIEHARADAAGRAAVVAKLRVLKSVAHLRARERWYAWRAAMHAALNAKLAENAASLSRALAGLEARRGEISEAAAAMAGVASRAAEAAAEARERHARYAHEDWDAAAAAEAALVEVRARLAAERAAVEDLAARENLLRAAAAERETQRDVLLRETAREKDGLRHARVLAASCSPDALDAGRASFALLQGVCGWRVLALSPADVRLQHVRSRLAVRLSGAEGLVAEVDASTLDADQSDRGCGVLRHAPRLLSGPLPPGDVRDALLLLGSRIDALAHLDRQLALAAVVCVPAVGAPSPDAACPAAVPVALSFVHAATRRRLDVLLAADAAGALSLVRVVPLAPLGEHAAVPAVPAAAVTDAVALALGAAAPRHTVVRRVVQAVVDVLDAQ